jgi:hypothetical protein
VLCLPYDGFTDNVPEHFPFIIEMFPDDYPDITMLEASVSFSAGHVMNIILFHIDLSFPHCR